LLDDLIEIVKRQRLIREGGFGGVALLESSGETWIITKLGQTKFATHL